MFYVQFNLCGFKKLSKLEEDYIYKDRGLLRPKSRIRRSDIENTLILGSTLRIVDIMGKEFNIKLDIVKINDIEILKKNLAIL